MAGYKGTAARFGRIPSGSALYAVTNLAREADRLSRDAGRFVKNAQEALTAAHHVMAYKMQQYQVDVLNEEIERTGRPQRGGARLEKSIMDERNRVLRANGWAVGIPAWLDQSPAGAYWRVIEGGTGPYDTQGLFFKDREGTVRDSFGEGSRSALMLLQLRGTRAPVVHVSGIEARRYMVQGRQRWSRASIPAKTYQEYFRRYGLGDYLKLRGELSSR